MPRDTRNQMGRLGSSNNTIDRVKNRQIDFDSFVKRMRIKAQKRKPVKTGQKPRTGTLFAKRNKRLTIRESALRRVSIIIKYRKVTSNEIKNYEINAYSWRYRKLKKGYRKVLFAQDKKDKKQIKMFVLRNILNVSLTDRKFKPNYPVEIR